MPKAQTKREKAEKLLEKAFEMIEEVEDLEALAELTGMVKTKLSWLEHRRGVLREKLKEYT